MFNIIIERADCDGNILLRIKVSTSELDSLKREIHLFSRSEKSGELIECDLKEPVRTKSIYIHPKAIFSLLIRVLQYVDLHSWILILCSKNKEIAMPGNGKEELYRIILEEIVKGNVGSVQVLELYSEELEIAYKA